MRVPGVSIRVVDVPRLMMSIWPTMLMDCGPGRMSKLTVFRDSAGVGYSTGGSAAVTLAAGQTTTLDLGVPLPDGRGLTLILTIPPDPPLEQVLVVEAKTS